MRFDLIPRDAAAIMAVDIAATAGIAAAPLPVPEDLGADLPIAIVEPLGGRRSSVVIDRVPMSIEVYASTDAAAQTACARVCGAVASLGDGTAENASHWLSVDVSTLPYNDPDPRHPTLARWSCAIDAYIRAGVDE